MLSEYISLKDYRKIALHLHETGVTTANVAAALEAVGYQIHLGDTTYSVEYDVIENLLEWIEWRAANNKPKWVSND